MIALFPWEDIDVVLSEQAEADIWSDAEYQQWLDAFVGKPAEMLSFAEEALMFAPRTGGWSAELLAGAVDVLPEWQREDYVGA